MSNDEQDADNPDALGKKKPADAIDKDDLHKVEKLSKLGHEDDEKPEGDEAAE